MGYVPDHRLFSPLEFDSVLKESEHVWKSLTTEPFFGYCAKNFSSQQHKQRSTSELTQTMKSQLEFAIQVG